MAERAVADIVGEGDGFGEVFVGLEGAGDGTADGGHFDGVREAGAVMVGGAVDEHLGLVFQAAEGAAVEDAVTIALKFGAVGMRLLGMAAAA